jgi:glycosyltransferase involved in cell wall biosynthesis
MNPLVSVMIPVYNGAAYLGEAIESVLAQTYRPLELIVVDDGSDDGSDEVARVYGDDLLYVRQRRGGNGAARNRALEHATADFFAFLDADDRFTPEKLERQMATLQANPELDMVFGHVVEFVSPELDEAARSAIRPPAEGPRPWASPNLMLIRRASFFRAGLFSATLRVGVTVDWYARAQEQGLRSLALDDVVLERRIHTQNNGLRERDARLQYVQVLKAAIDRRRDLAAGGSG